MARELDKAITETTRKKKFDSVARDDSKEQSHEAEWVDDEDEIGDKVIK